jgi:hypothetical protein
VDGGEGFNVSDRIHPSREKAWHMSALQYLHAINFIEFAASEWAVHRVACRGFFLDSLTFWNRKFVRFETLELLDSKNATPRQPNPHLHR